MNLHFETPGVFIDSFLQPLSRITDSGIMKIEPSKISCLIATGDGTIIVYGEYTDQFKEIVDPLTLNIPDLKKLHKLLNLIDGAIDLAVDTNSVSYDSDAIRFKYHLFENGIIKTPSLNMSKLATIPFDSSFSITNEKLHNLLKGSTLNPDINKIYLSFKENKVYAEITDKSKHNTDSYATLISENYTGPTISKPIPVNFEIIRLLNSSKIAEFKAKLSTKLNVFNFELISDKVVLNYIVSALIN